MNYIIYNGINSKQFNSLIVNKLPEIVRPARKYNKVMVDGRDGAIYEDLGYEDSSRTIEISVRNYTEIDEILSWLTGEGYAVFSNEPDKKYYIRLYNAIGIEKLIRYGQASIRFICSPYKYLNEEKSTTSLTVNNVGTVTAKPYMKIMGSGSTMLLIDGKEVCVLNIEDDYLELDSESMECSRDGVLKNRKILGRFPEFSPGEHIIGFQGGTVTMCETLVRSRFI